MKAITRKKFNNTIYFFSSIMIIAMFCVNTKALLNISGAIPVLLTIIGRYYYKDFKFLHLIKKKFIKKDFLVISANLFLIWTLFVSIFLSVYPILAITDFVRKTHYLIFFIIISLGLIATDTRYKSWLIKCFRIIPALTIAILFALVSIKVIQNDDSMFGYIRQHQVNLIILLPFLLLQLLLSKKPRFLLASITLAAIFFIFAYGGSRGAFGALITQSVIILFFYFKNQNSINTYKKIMYLSMILIASIATVMIAKNNITFFQHKINQGLNSSGRDVIIKTRFPVFIKYGSITHGVGFGVRTYQKFLADNNVPKTYGTYQRNTTFHYYTDEPLLLNVFYTSGAIGLVLYIIFLGSMTIKMTQVGLKNEKRSYIAIAILTAFIGQSLSALFGNGMNNGIILPLFLYSTWLILDHEIEKDSEANKINLEAQSKLIINN